MSQLRIGLTMRVVDASNYVDPRDALSHDWPECLRRVLPEAAWMPVPNLGVDIAGYVRDWGLNGFILTGGNNISEYPVRDVTELALIEYALDNHLPILGICRGFQIMAHYFGCPIEPRPGHAGTRHDVVINGNTHVVNSWHDNCAPGEMNPPLVAFAKDMEGRIEGFRHSRKPLMAVMWHPEREHPVASLDRRLIRGGFGLVENL